MFNQNFRISKNQRFAVYSAFFVSVTVNTSRKDIKNNTYHSQTNCFYSLLRIKKQTSLYHCIHLFDQNLKVITAKLYFDMEIIIRIFEAYGLLYLWFFMNNKDLKIVFIVEKSNINLQKNLKTFQKVLVYS